MPPLGRRSNSIKIDRPGRKVSLFIRFGHPGMTPVALLFMTAPSLRAD
jgi:hypothetical protein